MPDRSVLAVVSNIIACSGLILASVSLADGGGEAEVPPCPEWIEDNSTRTASKACTSNDQCENYTRGRILDDECKPTNQFNPTGEIDNCAACEEVDASNNPIVRTYKNIYGGYCGPLGTCVGGSDTGLDGSYIRNTVCGDLCEFAN